jgi:riboflavin synthase
MNIGIADTMFARGDMGKQAIKTINESGKEVEIERATVPGFKDLPVACKKLIEEKNCNIVIALAMVGKEDIDETCAHEANLGLLQAELMTNTHILKVFVHEREAINDDETLSAIMKDRVIKHTINALDLLFNPSSLTERAGSGLRQGGKNAVAFEL